MSAIRLACKNCDNIGYPSENGEKTGFTMDVMTMTLVNMQSHGDGNVADIVGNEPVENPVERIAQAAPKGWLKCDICGSTDVDVMFEVDMIQERKEDMVVEQLVMDSYEGTDEFLDDISIDEPLLIEPEVDIDLPTLQLDESMFKNDGEQV